jgi:three-Cys-motif partner protein
MSEVGDSAGQGSRHAFGGAWTLIKLEVIKKYLNAYTTALKNKGYRLIYIDGFAGSGSIDIWTGLAEDDGRYDGSAKIAIANTPPFTDLIFIEKQHQRVKELRELAAVHANRRIEIRRGDANGELASLCDSYSWRESRAVLFLDPYGPAVEWATLQRIAATKAIDVWYLFPLAGLYGSLRWIPGQ